MKVYMAKKLVLISMWENTNSQGEVLSTALVRNVAGLNGYHSLMLVQ